MHQPGMGLGPAALFALHRVASERLGCPKDITFGSALWKRSALAALVPRHKSESPSTLQYGIGARKRARPLPIKAKKQARIPHAPRKNLESVRGGPVLVRGHHTQPGLGVSPLPLNPIRPGRMGHSAKRTSIHEAPEDSGALNQPRDTRSAET